MFLRLKKTSFKRRPLSYGLLAGLVLSAILIFEAAPLYQPWPAEGADPSEACMLKSECSEAMSKAKECDTETGCCIEDRCFIPEFKTHICANSGASTDTSKDGGSERMGFCYAKSPPFELAIAFGPTKSVIDLSQYIQTLYKYAIGIAAVMAAAVMMIGGLMFLTAGSSERVSRGKEFIVDALAGLAVILLAYVILNTINPDTLTLQLPKIPVIKKQMFAGCQMTGLCRPCGERYALTQKYMDLIKAGGYKMGAVNDQKKACSEEYIVNPNDQKAKATCYGTSCYCASNMQCKDTEYKCRKRRKPGVKQDCSVPLVDHNQQPIGGAPPASTSGQQPPADSSQGGTPAAAAEPPYLCQRCVQDNGNCAPNGMNDNCCSGFCAGERCTSGQPGAKCGAGVIEGMMGGYEDQCITRICQTNWGNFCSTGAAGVPCGADSKECKPGTRCQTKGGNQCTPGTRFSWCDTSKECKSPFVCHNYLCLATNEWKKKCDPGKSVSVPENTAKTTKSPRKKNPDCPADAPVCIDFSGNNNFCSSGTPGTPCDENSDCISGTHCFKSMCTGGEEGDPCDRVDGYCASGFCYSGDQFSICVSGGPGSKCSKPGTAGCLPGYNCLNKTCMPLAGTCPGKDPGK